jgi:hypothetical protein
LYAVVFGLNPTMNGHYLLPACPLIAIALASALTDCSSAAARVAINSIAVVVLAALAGLSLLAIAQAGREVVSLIIGLGCLVFAGATMWSLRRLGQMRLLARLAIAFYLFFPLASVVLRPWLLPDFGSQVAAVAASRGVGSVDAIAFEGSEALASRIRVQSGGRLKVVVDDAARAIANGRRVIVAPAADAPRLESQGYSVEPAGGAIAKVQAIEVIRALVRLDLGRFLESAKQRYVIAFRASASGRNSS